MAAEIDRSGLEALEFTLDDLRLAVEARAVVELARAVAIVPLPGAPPVVEGAVAHRGAIVPAVDLRRRFGRPSRPVRLSDHLLVVRAGERTVALRVDRALALRVLDPAAIVEAARLSPGTGRFSGVVRTADGLILLQDLARLLDPAEAATLDLALAEGP